MFCLGKLDWLRDLHYVATAGEILELDFIGRSIPWMLKMDGEDVRSKGILPSRRFSNNLYRKTLNSPETVIQYSSAMAIDGIHICDIVMLEVLTHTLIHFLRCFVIQKHWNHFRCNEFVWHIVKLTRLVCKKTLGSAERHWLWPRFLWTFMHGVHVGDVFKILAYYVWWNATPSIG